MTADLRPSQWRARARELEERLNRLADALARAQARAQLAEKSARDAWAFTKMLRGSRSSER
jgi:hypothetical protein